MVNIQKNLKNVRLYLVVETGHIMVFYNHVKSNISFVRKYFYKSTERETLHEILQTRSEIRYCAVSSPFPGRTDGA